VSRSPYQKTCGCAIRGPVTLGHERAGEVIAVGPGVAGIEPGDHVILVWIPPCGRCRLCLGGQPQLCTEVRRARAGLVTREITLDGGGGGGHVPVRGRPRFSLYSLAG
jgi:S-(hydroxymethyl)glutathione dehydrogenase/alcohol dehydrogenase